MNIKERTALRKLQDRAIRAIELLHPHTDNLNDRRTYPLGPTVQEVRVYTHPDLEWLWNEWIEKAKEAGHKV